MNLDKFVEKVIKSDDFNKKFVKMGELQLHRRRRHR